MGMAASQARYLGLTARKTNCEWEGQQINQARTALANQSANYFNQLLGLQVPDCPDKTDYTKTQYSYSDGNNDSVLDNWRQLSDSTNDYNYIVDHYYYADIYTGSKKLMSDPQVTYKVATTEDSVSTKAGGVTYNDLPVYDDEGNMLAYGNSYSVVDPESGETTYYQDLSNYKYDKEMQNAILDLIQQGLIPKEEGTAWDEITSETISSLRGYHDGTAWHFATVSELEGASNKDNWTLNEGYADLANYKDAISKAGYTSEGKLADVDEIDETTLKSIQSDLGLPATQLKDGYTDLSTYDDLNALSETDKNKVAKVLKENGIITTKDELPTWIAEYNETFKAGNKYLSPDGQLVAENDAKEEDLTNVKDWLSTNYLKDNDYYKTSGEVTDVDTAYKIPTFRDMTTVFNPQYVGNQKLEDLGSLSAEDEAALAQIVKDCEDSTLITGGYITLNTDGSIDYSGAGVYKFDWNGVTKYTTYEDLVYSMQTPLVDEKPIDAQLKLATYEANYVNTEVTETEKALLETDGEGRFKSVKFESDSTTYVLNCESVTDEDAYNDAMNAYYQDVQEYEKTIADINAKTEIIQQQDRTLELRLKQLDTEQNALQTEMEAVKKVISKNVEMTFKTFSGS